MSGEAVHLAAVAGTLLALAVGHLAGTATRRAVWADREPAQQAQASLAAMVVRMFTTGPLLLLWIVVLPRWATHGQAGDAAGTGLEPDAARLIVGAWAAGGYALLTAIEARAALRAHRRAARPDPCKTPTDR